MHPSLRHTYYYSQGGGEQFDDVYAAYGTDFEDLLLPEGVTWQEGSYDPLTEGTYELTGSGGNTVNVILEKFALKLDPSNLATMQQRSTTQTFDGHVEDDNDNVGTFYDLARGWCFASSTFGVLDGYLIKCASASNYIIQSADGFSNYFKPLHAVSPSWSIFFIWRFDSGSDGVVKTMFSNAGATSNDAGIHVRKTTGDKIQILLGKKSAGNFVITYTTTQTINEASGIFWGVININGAGTGTGSITLKTTSGVDVAETFNVAAGADVTSSAGLAFAVSSAQSFGPFRILPRVATADEITAWKNYTPTRHTTEFLIKSRELDFTDDTKIFSDASGTVQITDGGNIRYVKDKCPSPFGLIPHYTSAADASAPLWRDNSGDSYAEFDGAKNLDLVGRITPEGSGKFTLFIVAQNDDDTDGSRYLSASTGVNVYMAQTGLNYVDAAFDNPYFIIHPNSGFATSIGPLTAQSGINFYCFKRSGDLCKVINSTDAAFTEDTDVNTALFHKCGGAENLEWWIEGRVYRIIKYSGEMSDARALAIRDALKTKYGIS